MGQDDCGATSILYSISHEVPTDPNEGNCFQSMAHIVSCLSVAAKG